MITICLTAAFRGPSIAPPLALRTARRAKVFASGADVRLDKLLAERGAGSRKDVDRLIRKGLVELDGEACPYSSETPDGWWDDEGDEERRRRLGTGLARALGGGAGSVPFPKPGNNRKLLFGAFNDDAAEESDEEFDSVCLYYGY